MGCLFEREPIMEPSLSWMRLSLSQTVETELIDWSTLYIRWVVCLFESDYFGTIFGSHSWDRIVYGIIFESTETIFGLQLRQNCLYIRWIVCLFEREPSWNHLWPKPYLNHSWDRIARTHPTNHSYILHEETIMKPSFSLFSTSSTLTF